MKAELEHRFSRGLTFMAGFTWSKAIDTGSAIPAKGSDRLFPANPYYLSLERGLSEFHTWSRVVGRVIYELPFGHGKALAPQGVASALFCNWQLATALVVSDGNPAQVGYIGDRNKTGVNNYPEATGIGPIPESQKPERF